MTGIKKQKNKLSSLSQNYTRKSSYILCKAPPPLPTLENVQGDWIKDTFSNNKIKRKKALGHDALMRRGMNVMMRMRKYKACLQPDGCQRSTQTMGITSEKERRYSTKVWTFQADLYKTTKMPKTNKWRMFLVLSTCGHDQGGGWQKFKKNSNGEKQKETERRKCLIITFSICKEDFVICAIQQGKVL